MNKVILTARAMLEVGYQVVFLEKRINFVRKAGHDLSDKNVFAGTKLSVSVTPASFLSLVCWITSATASFCSFFIQAVTILCIIYMK